LYYWKMGTETDPTTTRWLNDQVVTEFGCALAAAECIVPAASVEPWQLKLSDILRRAALFRVHRCQPEFYPDELYMAQWRAVFLEIQSTTIVRNACMRDAQVEGQQQVWQWDKGSWYTGVLEYSPGCLVVLVSGSEAIVSAKNAYTRRRLYGRYVAEW
jgi:hypothetical protein